MPPPLEAAGARSGELAASDPPAAAISWLVAGAAGALTSPTRSHSRCGNVRYGCCG